MRIEISIERLPESCRSYLVGPDATRILAGIEGVSAIRVEQQYLDKAVLTYERPEAERDLTRIDQTLQSAGMRRVP